MTPLQGFLVLEKVKSDTDLKSCADTFVIPKQTAATIKDVGCKAMAIIFGGKSADYLGSLCYTTLRRWCLLSRL